MRIFDQTFPYIGRGRLPTVLCIDEIGFKTEDGSYASILYDHDKKNVVDVIRNRKLDYLRDYFNHCSFKERIGVKFFISDLYEGYKTIKEEYFRDAIHIADMFHVIKLLRDEISRLRVLTYKNSTDEGDPERGFMKNHWDYFEKYLDTKLAYKDYYCKSENYTYTTWQMMQRCLKLNQTFWDAYACLQDFYDYWSCKNYEAAINFIELISKKLKRCEDEGLTRVGETYHKWRVEIANAITCKNEQGKRYSNGPAEGLNNSIKTLVKDANGYKNFERFRKRILLVLNKRKDLPL
jgi:transposase